MLSTTLYPSMNNQNDLIANYINYNDLFDMLFISKQVIINHSMSLDQGGKERKSAFDLTSVKTQYLGI